MIARRSQALVVAVTVLLLIPAGCARRRSDPGRALAPSASDRPRDRRVIILALDRTSLAMLRAGMPTLRRLMSEEAAIGLMPRRSSGDRWQRHISMWATLGAGRAAAGTPALVPFPVSPMGKGPELGAMGSALKNNRRHHTLARPGALGDALHRQGLRTAAVGGLAHDPWDRWLAAADSQGRLDCVEFGGHDLLRSFDRCADANLVLIDYPATRVADVRPASWDDAHRAALSRADSLLAGLLRRLRSGRDLLIVLSPTGPSYRRARDRSMGPVILIGAGHGLLTSLSTRREGVVTAADVAPTALAWLGVATPPEMTGRPMAVRPAADASSRVRWLDRRISATFAERFVIVPIASAAEVGIVIILAVWWLLRPESLRRWRGSRLGPLLGYALLLALLPLPWFGLCSTGEVVAIWLGLAIIAAALTCRFGPLAGPAAVNAATAALIAADIAAGGNWLRYSVLGSDTIIGGRFYGIGNERAALFLCSLALAAGFAVQRRRWRGSSRAIVGLAFVGGVVLVGLAVLGANWGSAIVLTVGFGLAYARLGVPRVRARHVVAVAAAAVLVATGLILADRWWGSNQSHLGSVVESLLAGNPSAAWATYARKMASNWGLLGLSPLAIGFLGMVAAMLWLVTWPPPRLAAALSRCRAVTATVVGCLAAMCVGMVVNDTGAVAAAIISIMVMQTLVYLMLLPGESDASAGR